jgi:hypothetical protein
MLGQNRVLALCTSAALALNAGCTPDSPTAAGPDAQFEQSGLRAAGAAQISGIGYYAEDGQCTDPQGDGSSYKLVMTGDLQGCHYVFIETASCSPGGTYTERGTETFVGLYNGAHGTFRTTYLFTAKFTECTTSTGEIAPAGEIVGRCQHPLVAGSGEGVFEGVTGRVDMKDDIETGSFPYRGHFRS